MDAETRNNKDEGRCHELEQTRSLLRELSDVLQPEPLPETVEQYICDRIAERSVRPARILLRPACRIGLAAAAAVLALVVLSPSNGPRSPVSAPTAVTLSARDAADIVSAYGVLSWGGSLDQSLERVSSELDAIEQQIERAPEASASLPWGSEDDWDAPPTDHNTVSPRPAVLHCRNVTPYDFVQGALL